MESWPTSIFPAPNVDLNGNKDDSAARTPMDSGRIRQRARDAREQRTYPVSWTLTDFQFGMFQSWVLYKLSNGADWFEMDLPTGGEGMKTVQVRLVGGKFSWKYQEVMHWVVSAQLEVADAQVWSEDLFDLLLTAGDITELEEVAAWIDTYVTH